MTLAGRRNSTSMRSHSMANPAGGSSTAAATPVAASSGSRRRRRKEKREGRKNAKLSHCKSAPLSLSHHLASELAGNHHWCSSKLRNLTKSPWPLRVLPNAGTSPLRFWYVSRVAVVVAVLLLASLRLQVELWKIVSRGLGILIGCGSKRFWELLLLRGSLRLGAYGSRVFAELVTQESILPLPESIQNGTESKGLVLTSHESILALLESIPLRWNCVRVFRVDGIDLRIPRIDSYPSRDETSLPRLQGIDFHPSGIDSGPKYFKNCGRYRTLRKDVGIGPRSLWLRLPLHDPEVLLSRVLQGWFSSAFFFDLQAQSPRSAVTN
ncbi:hypothetical protein PIB30_061941 [Stylosanthes scabra]|uniref:Uncharacterized protein n=1 Tax=Stylosanthes scabra TaxID=79078 RepID=A0ABU6WKT2_9FABA|nr:hypothetical protein [Stylosanthes scabra]